MRKPNIPKTIAFLPGCTYTDYLGEKHHKIQQLSLINGIQQEKTNYITEPYDPLLIDSLKTKTQLNLTLKNTRRPPENDQIPRIQPPWLKYDRQVLKFHCYFQESVVENSIENFRIRKCAIYYYLSDDTIHVNEPKQENSGIPQGMFIKRQKIPKKLGQAQEILTWHDLNLGININFFQRVFRIVDCDSFTKEFFSYMDVRLNNPEEMPTDSYSVFKDLKDIKINPPDTKEYKEYNEVKLKGGHPNGGLDQYLSNDRKVLSFSVFWQDNTLEGGLNYYILNFFLADDTMEVKEIRRHNSGKDPFPLLLNRQKIPKAPILTHYPGMTQKKEQFYSPQDLICGQSVIIHNKEVFIYDCDEFTKHWFQQNLGISQQKALIPEQQGTNVKHQVPPYNGFGSEEDSLQNVYALQPKPPRKDMNKMYTEDQYILRFEARLLSQAKEDNMRNFIISFFCGNDSIQVYEVSDKNSGIWQGKFLERMKHKNPVTANFFVEKDFQIGESVQIGVFRFQLLKADEFTHKYMKSKPNVFKEADISQVLAKLKSQSSKYQSYEAYLVDLVRNLDTNNNGVIEFQELVEGLKNLGISATHQEAYTLMRYFDKDGNWKLDMKELFIGLGGKK